MIDAIPRVSLSNSSNECVKRCQAAGTISPDLIESGPFAGLKRHHYRAIAFDPPWTFSAGTKGRPQHYKRMTDHAIAELPIAELAHPDGCFLFMWVTSPKAYRPKGSKTRLNPDEIARRQGFSFSSRAFVWIKTERAGSDPLFFFADGLHTGTGLTTRKNAEDVLLFRRGKPKRSSGGVHEIILAPIREHSRKPDTFFERVERFCPGPYVEVFGRQSRPGWDVWGDEATKFDFPSQPLSAEDHCALPANRATNAGLAQPSKLAPIISTPADPEDGTPRALLHAAE